MTLKDKQKSISELSEKALRESVLLPLLSNMGFRAPTINHGPNERGKDIVAIDVNRMGKREYLAVVAKATDLDGSVSSSNSLREVLHQVEQCFDNSYGSPYDMRNITMDRVWVVTSGRIVPGAADSVFESLKKHNLDKLVQLIDQAQLIELIDKHFSEYWDQSEETVDGVREQKERLLRFTRELLRSLGGGDSDIKETLNAVLHSYMPPSVAIPTDRSLTRLSPYRVEIDKISDKYAHGLWADSCGLISDAFLEAKEEVFHAMFDVEEIVDHYEKVIEKQDPHEFLGEFDASLCEDYPFWHASFGSAARAVHNLDYLRDGLQEIDDLLEKLEKRGKKKWALALLDSVAALKPDIDEFLQNADEDQEEFRLQWQIVTKKQGPFVRLVHGKRQSPEATIILTRHKRTVESYTRGINKRRTITTKDVMIEVYAGLKKYFDSVLE
jgi:hypothetical protein